MILEKGKIIKLCHGNVYLQVQQQIKLTETRAEDLHVFKNDDLSLYFWVDIGEEQSVIDNELQELLCFLWFDCVKEKDENLGKQSIELKKKLNEYFKEFKMTKIENMTIGEIKKAVENCGIYCGAKFSEDIKEEIVKKTVAYNSIDFCENYLKASKKSVRLLDFTDTFNKYFAEHSKFCCGKKYIQKIKDEGIGKDIFFVPKKKKKKKPTIAYNPFLDSSPLKNGLDNATPQ